MNNCIVKEITPRRVYLTCNSVRSRKQYNIIYYRETKHYRCECEAYNFQRDCYHIRNAKEVMKNYTSLKDEVE